MSVCVIIPRGIVTDRIADPVGRGGGRECGPAAAAAERSGANERLLVPGQAVQVQSPDFRSGKLAIPDRDIIDQAVEKGAVGVADAADPPLSRVTTALSAVGPGRGLVELAIDVEVGRAA